MLKEYQIKLILRETFRKSEEIAGGEGWAKDDIEKAIYAAGGSKDDVYKATSLALDICADSDRFKEYAEMIRRL